MEVDKLYEKWFWGGLDRVTIRMHIDTVNILGLVGCANITFEQFKEVVEYIKNCCDDFEPICLKARKFQAEQKEETLKAKEVLKAEEEIKDIEAQQQAIIDMEKEKELEKQKPAELKKLLTQKKKELEALKK